MYSDLIPHRQHESVHKTYFVDLSARWERMYRQVFWLADGHKTLTHIAFLLYKPVWFVEAVTRDLLIRGHFRVKVGEKEFMMNRDLLASSYNLIAPNAENFAHLFYSKLFEKYPTTRALFPVENVFAMRKQEHSLMATLAFVITGMGNVDEQGRLQEGSVTSAIRSLGVRHATRHGAAATHYPLVGEVLLETLQDFLGEACTPDILTAWEQAYGIISNEMMYAADTHRQRSTSE